MQHRIAEKIRSYKPGKQVILQLRDVHFVALIGPSASGKNAIAHGLEDLNRGFKKVISFTTRPPRPEEVDKVDYHFKDTDKSFFKEFEEQLDEGRLVQAAMHSTTGDYYYSTIESYNPGGKSMLDILPRAVEDMRKIPFGNRSEIMIAVPFEQWLKRFNAKSSEWDKQATAERKQEAIDNLSWGLSQPGIAWVMNRDGELGQAVEDVSSVVNDTYDPSKSDKARQMGKDMLNKLSGS